MTTPDHWIRHVRGYWAIRRCYSISCSFIALSIAAHAAAAADPGTGKGTSVDAAPAQPSAAPTAKGDSASEAAWQRARAEANRRVREFEAAVQSGDAARIRRAALEVQSDPLATHHINRNRPDLVEANNRVVQEIRSDATRRMREQTAREWNRANPDQPPITADDVDVYQPRNWRDPNARATSPQDWDVTIRVRGKDLPPERARNIVNESFFEAAGGKQSFGEHATPEQVAGRQRIETTSGRSPEAYKEPEKIIGTSDSPPRHGERLQDPEQLTRAIEHKSNTARNEADAARTSGDPVRAAQHEFDEIYQASKQYERIAKPRVEAAGGRIDSRVDEGMRILSQVGPDGISPAEARARLAQMGETPESIIQKAAGQAEAAQVLGKARTTGTDAPEGGARTSLDSPEGRSRVPADAPDARTRTPADAPEASPGKLGKAMEVVGKGMQAVDILAGAEDAKTAIQDGDMGKLRDTAINTVDGLAGGPLATTRMAQERLGRNREEKNEAQEQARQSAESALEQQMRVDLRRSGLSKDEVDAILEARARGDDRPLKDAYEKAGKEVPRYQSPDPTVGETLSNYGAEVLDNAREVKDGLADRAQKAKEFVTQTGRDMKEIATGLTEKGVASEIIVQQKDNWTKDNLKAGAEHIAEKGRELIGLKETDREREQGAAKELADKLVEKGVAPETAQKVAADYIAHAGAQGTAEQLRDALEQARTSTEGGGRARDDQARETPPGGRPKSPGRVANDNGGGGRETAGRSESPDARSGTRDTPPLVSTTKAPAGHGAGDRERDDGAPRNDAGQRVDAGQYREGDMIVTGDGTEYEKRGEQWEKTGRSYGAYSSDRTSRGGLAAAEPRAGPAHGPAQGQGGLGSLLDRRNEQSAGHTQSSLGLMGDQQNVQHASTRGEQAARDARAALDAAGRDAQSTGEKTAAQTAGAQRESSLGNAVANGVQQAVEKGLTSAADSFGKAAADRVSNSIFKDGAGHGSSSATSGGAGLAGEGGSSAGTPAGSPQVAATSKSSSSHSHSTKGGRSSGDHRSSGSTGSSSGGTASGSGTPASSDDSSKSVTVTCPGCGRSVTAAPGESVQCPYCVTMTCPRCGYTRNYPRGEEPDSCPMCYTTTCPLCGRQSWARRDQPTPQCPYCIRIRCSKCGSLLYAGDRSSVPASLPCSVCTAREAEKQGKTE